MKKINILLTFFFILSTNFVYPETITGLFNIDFGTSKEDTLSELNKLGWKRLPLGNDYLFSRGNPTYGNVKITALAVEFYDNQFYGFTVHIKYNLLNDQTNKQRFAALLELLESKYGFNNPVQNINEKNRIGYLCRNMDSDIYQITIDDETQYFALCFYSGEIDEDKKKAEQILRDKIENDM